MRALWLVYITDGHRILIMHNRPVHQQLKGFWAMLLQPVSLTSLTALCMTDLGRHNPLGDCSTAVWVMANSYRQRTAICMIKPLWTCMQC